jgi:hypothetical protein
VLFTAHNAPKEKKKNEIVKKNKNDNQHARLSIILLFTDFHFCPANRAQMNFIVS